MIRFAIFGTFLVVMLTVTQRASADPGPVVVELFTSQGCSACPPADKLMNELAARDDVIALALHVDYWDYIGWTDTFAKAVHTRRQKDYAHAAGRSMVFTPQFVVNGGDDVQGARAMELADLIAHHRSLPPQGTMEIKTSGQRVTVELVPSDLTGGDVDRMDILVLRYVPTQRVAISGGENADRQIEYSNVVTEIAKIGRWNGRSRKEVTIELVGGARAVIMVQGINAGPIISARKVPVQ
jgi:hypothetical protein